MIDCGIKYFYNVLLPIYIEYGTFEEKMGIVLHGFHSTLVMYHQMPGRAKHVSRHAKSIDWHYSVINLYRVISSQGDHQK